jgi:hypothetical protein
VRTSGLESAPAILLAVIVTVNIPAVVGVPEIAPLAVSTDSPPGSPVALKLVGLFSAVMV